MDVPSFTPALKIAEQAFDCCWFRLGIRTGLYSGRVLRHIACWAFVFNKVHAKDVLSCAMWLPT